MFGLVAGACGDDDPGATAEGGGSEDTAVADDSGGEPACTTPEDCDDQDPCTADVCTEGVCGVDPEPVLSNECRPQIDVEYPPRGATIQAEASTDLVTVTGTVSSRTGDVQTLTINGAAVEFDGEGRFSYDVVPKVGGNFLVIEIADSAQYTRRRVQSFLWSTRFEKPTEPKQGMSPEGLAIYFSQEVLDDGDRSEPVDDLATVLDAALSNFDLGTFIGGAGPVASTAGYDVYVTALDLGSTEVALTSRDGGLHLFASLQGIVGDLDFQCGEITCEIAGGDGTGGLSIAEIAIDAELDLVVNDEFQLEAVATNVVTTIDPDDVEIWSDNGWTNFLLGIIRPFIMNGLVEDLATGLNGQLGGVLGPLLADGLNGLAFDTVIEMPNLADENAPISINLLTDFNHTDFHDGLAPPDDSPPQGGVFFQRGGGFVAEAKTPYDNLGIPLREGCGGPIEPVALPRVAPLEIALADDLLNQILYAAWRGGLLEFPFDASGLESEGGGGLVSNLNILGSGMLAPAATDCNEDGTLLAHVGDIRLDATLDFLGEPMTFTAFASLTLRLEVVAAEDGIGISIAGADQVMSEITIHEDHLIESEPLVLSTLEFQLVDGLIGALGGGALGSISLPEIDLSEQLGLPPGSAVIKIQTEGVQRVPGATVIDGHL